jgi:hypothetical protein
MERKKTTSSVEVFKVKGETMAIAFKNLKQEHSFDNHFLEIEKEEQLNLEQISNAAIYLRSKELHSKYINNIISEYAIRGALYNVKPKLRDNSRIVMHNVINRGTKQWETVNSYRTDTNVTLEEDTETKDIAMARAKELALEKNMTINVVVSKRLVDMDGILAVAEFLPYENMDDSNVYVFWVFTTKVESITEDELYAEETSIDSHGQLSLKEELYSYYGRPIIH